MIVDFFFWLFAAVLLISATLVVTSKNPVHSVLFLILAFFNAAALFLIAGAEFLAMILVVVYVGAVAVLFLFVVMMLDIDFEQLRGGLQRYAGIGAAVGAALLVEFAIALGGWKLAPNVEQILGVADPRQRQQHPGSGQHPLHRLPVPVSGRRPRAAGGDDRRDRADVARPQDVAASEHRACRPAARSPKHWKSSRCRSAPAPRKAAASCGRKQPEPEPEHEAEPVHGHH